MKISQHKLILAIFVGASSIYGAIAFYGGMKSDLAGETNFASRSFELGTTTPKPAPKTESHVILNDPAMKKNWGIANTDSSKAWNVSLGSRNVIVAVVDTGVDVKHPDLKNNLWTNPGETGRDALGRDKSANGLDDDGNGYVDDVHGWNFAQDNNDISDNHGHGSHIAGIVGAEGGNGIGISGVAPKVSMMILKYYDPHAPGMNNLRNTIRAFQYATKMKANIINYSGGGVEPSTSEKAAVEAAQRQGILFIAAAGNEQSNSDQKPYYPADYGLENILSVTAIDQKQKVLSSSNYGKHSVDIAAPGFEIYSTIPGGSYGLMTGTSQATAFVSGLAALILANNPQLSAYQVKKIITSTGDNVDDLTDKTRFRKKINSYRALAILDSGLGLNGIIAENAQRLKDSAFAVEDSETTPREPSASAPNISPFFDILKHAGLQRPGL